MKTFTLTIISDSKIIFSGHASYCGVTTLFGSLGLEAFHEPFFGVLRENSDITYTDSSGGSFTVTIESGILSFKDNTCTVTVSLPAPIRNKQSAS